jgi:hypothetical protein
METSYVYYIIDFIRFHGKRQPKAMGLEEIRACLSHLATEGNVVASTQSVLPSREFGRPNARPHPPRRDVIIRPFTMRTTLIRGRVHAVVRRRVRRNSIVIPTRQNPDFLL